MDFFEGVKTWGMESYLQDWMMGWVRIDMKVLKLCVIFYALSVSRNLFLNPEVRKFGTAGPGGVKTII